MFSDIFPFEKNNKIIKINNWYGSDEIKPDIIPLKVHCFDAINPVMSAPSITDADNNKFKVSGKTVAPFKIKAIITVMLNVTATPIAPDNSIPKKFLKGKGKSCFLLLIFFRIKKSLTFN